MGRQQHKKTQGFKHRRKIKAKELLYLKKNKKSNTLPKPLPMNTRQVIKSDFMDVFGDPLLFNMGKSVVVIGDDRDEFLGAGGK